jgi:L-ascorbate metabolism protein UlaG (beta-lactamase superfamily)
MASPEVAFLRANKSETTLTWIGHATVLLQIGGRNILTDPHLSERASPVSFAGPRRRVPPGLTLEQLPHVDAVVISHNHYDHLDADTITQLAAQAGGPPQFYVPLGLRRWFNELGIATVTELDWWESREMAGVKIHCVPVQHWSQRTLADRNQALWGGWVIEHPALRFFFTGDTGYSQDFKDIERRFGRFDVAAIPIGAYEPRWFMAPFHVNPAEAVQIHLDLKARYSLGIHWGTFEMTDEPLDEPPVVLERELSRLGIAPERFIVLRHGQTWRLGAPLAARN